MTPRGDVAVNPYAPPQAAVADRQEERPGRPVIVWIITVVFALGVLFDAAGTIGSLIGHPIGGEEPDPTLVLTSGEYLATLVIDALSLGSVVALFRLRRSALQLFVTAYVATAALVLLECLFRAEYRALFQGRTLIYVAVGWSINLAVLGYVWRLRVREVLRA
jgi:hypothetical protein